MTKKIYFLHWDFNNAASPTALDCAAFAGRLSDRRGLRSTAILLTDSTDDAIAEAKRIPDADLLIISGAPLKQPSPTLIAESIWEALSEEAVSALVLPHTPECAAASALIASRLGIALYSGIGSLIFSPEKEEVGATIFGGAIEKIDPLARECVITISGAGRKNESSAANYGARRGEQEIKIHQLQTAERESVSYYRREKEDKQLTEAEIVFGVGRGVGEIATVEIIERISSSFNKSAVGASRGACDMGLAPYSKQVGLTGKSISPQFYIAVGISGSPQHLAGLRGARTIIAINNDVRASIFDAADYGIVEDLNLLLPELSRIMDEKKKETS